MTTNHKPIIVAIALLVALSASVSAAPGDLDPTFGSGGRVIDGDGYPYDVAVQSDGKIVVVGSSSLADFVVARYNQDGSPDLTFGSGTGRVTTNLGGWPSSVVIQPDGKIVAGGVSGLSFFVVRYNSDGSFDTGFGGGTGKVLTALPCGSSGDNFDADFTIQPDGKLVGFFRAEYCAGYLIRYESDGSLDVSFGNHGVVTSAGGYFFSPVFVQPDGKILLGGGGGGVSRYESNGAPDLSFGSGGLASCPIPYLSSVIVRPDGKILLAGTILGLFDNTGVPRAISFALVRYNINGSLDTSFGLNGLVTTPIGSGYFPNGYLGSAAIQPDGKILAAGSSTGINGTSDFTLVRYNGDGSLDKTFGGGDGISTVDFNNSTDVASKVVLDSQGRAVVVGVLVGGLVGGSSDMFAIARFLLGDPTCTNPIDCADFFVRQHYRDFLNREPDAPGWAFWTDEITECNDPAKRQPGESWARCTDRKRDNTSAAFFLSPEFQNTGSFVLRVYWGTLGKLPWAQCGLPNGLLGSCRPLFSDYVADINQVAQGIVVNDKLAPDVINSNKRAFVDAFVNRPAFKAKYDALSNAQFVDTLFATTGITPSDADRSALINGLNSGTETRASVVFKVVDGTQTLADGALIFQTSYGKAFFDQEFDAAFVFMEYIGYLRRNPDQEGFDFWLAKLKRYGNWLDAEMVRSFIVSPEYRSRFSQP